MTDKPITFTDEQGNEWTLRRQRDDDEDADAVLLYDATPDDLARAGYLHESDAEPEMHRRFREWGDRVEAAVKLSVAERKELDALRAFEDQARNALENGRWEGPAISEGLQLLKAVDEARK